MKNTYYIIKADISSTIEKSIFVDSCGELKVAKNKPPCFNSYEEARAVFDTARLSDFNIASEITLKLLKCVSETKEVVLARAENGGADA